MQVLRGKTPWITGAGSGIGEAIALAYAAAGMRLVLSGRRAAELERVASACRASGAGSVRCAPLDIAQADEVQAVATSMVAQQDRRDIRSTSSAGDQCSRTSWHWLRPDLLTPSIGRWPRNRTQRRAVDSSQFVVRTCFALKGAQDP